MKSRNLKFFENCNNYGDFSGKMSTPRLQDRHPEWFWERGKEKDPFEPLIRFSSFKYPILPFPIVADIPELITLHTTQRHFNINTILFTQCTPAWSDTTERHYNAIKSVVLYFLPLGITSIAYLQIVRVLWRSGNIPGHLECRTPLNTISGNRREWGLP